VRNNNYQGLRYAVFVVFCLTTKVFKINRLIKVNICRLIDKKI